MNALLIAGTNTGVGKTVLTSALAAYWQRYRASRPLGILKPVQCGVGDAAADGDRAHYAHLFTLSQTLEEINPIHFQARLAPAIAAEREGASVQLEKAWHQFEALSQNRDFILVESSGGLGAPITYETTVADLAWDWRLPTVLVVPVQPGAIAQAVANVALARQSRVHLKGIILNCVQPCQAQEQEDWIPTDLLQSLTQKPVLGCIPHLSDPTDLSKLIQVAAHLDLERLLP
ncbi:MAG TPA: dethiobiotin synthase [Coleofasciculaceae cyanobacterium]